MSSSKEIKDIASRMGNECLLARVRKLNRILTGIYDGELRSFGLKAAQLNLLTVVSRCGPIRRVDIGKRLCLDPSTLTRNLTIMMGNGWLEEVTDSEDGRGFPLQVTAKGCDLLTKVVPSWQKAQHRSRALIGDDGENLLRKVNNKI